ncbi:MAG: hypothetical protein R3D60_01265 [Paracoccaceae bacterium]
MTLSFSFIASRRRALSRRLTSFVGASALIFAGIAASTQPARADFDGNDLFRLLAGAVVVGAIVNGINSSEQPHYISGTELPSACLQTMRVNGRNFDMYDRGCLRNAGYRNLPQFCTTQIRVGHRLVEGYVADCLYSEGYRAERRGSHRPQWEDDRGGRTSDRLPSRCEMTYRQGRQRVDGYWGQCLASEGLRNLPRSCRFNTTDGESVYNADCLRDAGYRAGRRR